MLYPFDPTGFVPSAVNKTRVGKFLKLETNVNGVSKLLGVGNRVGDRLYPLQPPPGLSAGLGTGHFASPTWVAALESGEVTAFLPLYFTETGEAGQM